LTKPAPSLRNAQARARKPTATSRRRCE
jgi:hypothetical protein